MPDTPFLRLPHAVKFIAQSGMHLNLLARPLTSSALNISQGLFQRGDTPGESVIACLVQLVYSIRELHFQMKWDEVLRDHNDQHALCDDLRYLQWQTRTEWAAA